MLMDYGPTSLQSAQGQWVLGSVTLTMGSFGHQLTSARFQANQKP